MTTPVHGDPASHLPASYLPVGPAPVGPRPVRIAAVAIGRNEGARLIRCLTSLHGEVDKIVYVDSGSADGSVEAARAMGVHVVELDPDVPFTAARGRNAGFDAVEALGGAHYVQFVDGDCGVVAGFVAEAAATLDAQPEWGIVTGWREEIHRSASVYNEMCDIEWHRPAGDIRSCGGDMMVRAPVFRAVGGFNAGVIASEDEEFCLRVRAAGHRVWRLPLRMTVHDAAMLRFGQWWRRNLRTGHGFAEVGGMHPDHFVAERRRVWFYGAAIPVLVVTGFVVSLRIELFLIFFVFGLSWIRTVRGLQRGGQPTGESLRHGAYYTLAKLPQLFGMLTFYIRRQRGVAAKIIEYK